MAETPTAVEAPAPPTQRGEPTVVLEDVDVTYRVYEDRRPSLRRLVASRFKPRSYRAIEAVRGVSLTAYQGEAVGVIGRNGSGKSTLLRAMAGLLPVTSGAVYAKGNPTLLGVGAALQPALSGRRNIMLGGLALGLPAKEIEQRFDEIVEFSGLRDAIDLPLQTYSSGMRARLHFAIATAAAPEILLIDEALSVGDEDFRYRSEQRINELRSKAGTIFLVSHSFGAVTSMCSRVIWMDKGRMVEEGEPKAVIKAYKSSVKRAGDGKAK